MEEIENKEVTEQVTTEDTQASDDLIKQATEAAERLEKANQQMADLMAKQASEKVKSSFAGESYAGRPQVSKEEKEIAEAKKFLAGTGYEDELF
jgi:cell division septum initiation protein DivIVA